MLQGYPEQKHPEFFTMLHIVKYIKEHGLDKAVEDFALSANEKDHKVLLKYSQIDSPFAHEEVRECRGLILEKDTWRVLSMPFKKFFNHGEQYADKIDWDRAHILEKVDGSLVTLYFDPVKDEWCVATSGLPEADGIVHNEMNLTFADLFWQTFEKMGAKLDDFDKDHVYCFELTSPYNIIVKPHSESRLTLLMIRNMDDLEEVPYEEVVKVGDSVNIPAVGSYKLGDAHDVGRLLREVEDWNWTHEGFVVVDDKFNRIKVKNPDYVAVHHLKSKTNEYDILDIVKTNELEEFVSTFPEREEEIYELSDKYHKLIEKLQEIYEKAYKPKNITGEERKKFAQSVKELAAEDGLQQYVGAFFMLQDGKAESIEEFIKNSDNKKLYKFLNNWNVETINQ